MKVSKYISVIALALVFAASSCTKLGGDLVECEGEHSQEEVDSPEASMMIITEDDTTPGGGITDPDHDEDHDRDEEKVIVVN